jgi:hypothetical protein
MGSDTQPPATVEQVVTRLCRLCRERPVLPSRAKHYDYRCSTCRNSTPAERAARRRWRKTLKGRAHERRKNARDNRLRIYVGREYHSRAPDAPTAAVVNAHIKERLSCHYRETRDRNEN